MAVLWLTGFEHGVNPITSGGGLFDAVSGSPVVDGSSKRSGNYGLHIHTDAAATQHCGKNVSGTGVSGRFYIQFKEFPSGSVSVAECTVAAGAGFRIRYDSTGHFGAYFVGGTNSVATGALSLDTWYLIDWSATCGTGTSTLSVTIDGSETITASLAQTATTWAVHRLGMTSSITGDFWIDDVIITNSTADYPIGAGTVEALLPTSDGTHNAGTNTMEDAAGNDINGTTYTAFSQVDEVPISESTTYIKQSAGNTAAYVEVNFADTSNTVIQGVTGILAYKSSATSANEGATVVITTDATVTIWGNATTRADYSESSVFYKSAVITMPSGGWTQSNVNSLKARMGYSNDVSPVPYWCNLILEVAYGVASGTVYYQTATGGFTPGGGIARQDGKVLGGGSTPGGAIAKMAGKLAAGTLTLAGGLVKKTARIVAGGLTPAGLLAGVKIVMRVLAGTLGIAGTVLKAANKAFTGGVASAGGLIKRTARTVAGGLTPGGLMTKVKIVLAALSGAVGMSGSLGRSTGKVFAWGVGLAGGLIKRIARALSGAVGSGGILGTVKTFLQFMTGGVAPGGNIGKNAGKTVAGLVGTAGGVIKDSRRSLSGLVGFFGAESGIRAIGVLLAGAVGVAGGLVRLTEKGFGGVVGLSGGIIRLIGKVLQGLIDFVGTLVSQTKIERVRVKVRARLFRFETMGNDGEMGVRERVTRTEVMAGKNDVLEVTE